MGNCNFKTEKEEQGAVLNKNQFNLHYIIGRGGFGKVKLPLMPRCGKSNTKKQKKLSQ